MAGSIFVLLCCTTGSLQTNDLAVTLFKLTPLRPDAAIQNGGGAHHSNGNGHSLNGNSRSNGSNGGPQHNGVTGELEGEASEGRLVTLKLAEVSGLVRGEERDYSVIIKVKLFTASKKKN